MGSLGVESQESQGRNWGDLLGRHAAGSENADTQAGSGRLRPITGKSVSLDLPQVFHMLIQVFFSTALP